MASQNSGHIGFVGDDIVYSRAGTEVWRIPLRAVRIVGEFTNRSGPAADDYFLAVVTDAAEGWWWEASFYAEGRDDFLASLGEKLGRKLGWSLCNSTDFRSVVIWPPQLAGRPMFEFRGEGLLGKLRLTSKQYLHPSVVAYVASNNAIDQTREG